MDLTEEQRALLDCGEGPELRLATATLVRYGEACGAPRLVPIKSAHLAGSFAISAYSGYYELLVSGVVLSEVWYGCGIPMVECPISPFVGAITSETVADVNGDTGEIVIR